MEFNGNTEDCETSPWIIRFTFQKEKMMEKGIIMEDVYISLMNYDNERIKFVFSDDNSKELIGRISIITDMKGTEKDLFNGLLDQSDIISAFKNIEDALINNVVIKGIKNITNISIDDDSVYTR